MLPSLAVNLHTIGPPFPELGRTPVLTSESASSCERKILLFWLFLQVLLLLQSCLVSSIFAGSAEVVSEEEVREEMAKVLPKAAE